MTSTHLSINEAAVRLGVKPWEVCRLIERGELDAVQLVEAESVDAYEERQ